MSKILIVEDDLLISDRLSKALVGNGYEVCTIADGEEALQKIRSQQYDLVVLDVMLPGLDGITLCRVIRRDAAIANVRIIMVTARGMEIDKIIGLESGADDYVVKPVALGEFLARVKAVLRQKNSRILAHKFEFGELSLDLLSRKVFKSGEEIFLSNKEFNLLAELMRNKGVVLSHSLIMLRVWGEDTFLDRRTVSVHIRWLRKKIEDDPSDPKYVFTVRGVGYRFQG